MQVQGGTPWWGSGGKAPGLPIPNVIGQLKSFAAVVRVM